MSLVISYPGVVGSFSQQAAQSFFGDSGEYLGFSSWEEAAQAVLEKKVDYGVFPIENSSAGIVPLTYEFLDKYPLHIVGERRLKVVHHLLGLPKGTLSGIQEIHSHPQAIAQCHNFLSAHPDYRLMPSQNTAVSAQYVARTGNPALAAIASRQAAKEYGLTILQENIHSNHTNTTRFVALSLWDTPIDKGAGVLNKATSVFTVENHIGALAQVLLCFANFQLNLSRIESRPVKDKPFEYFFCADFEGEMDEAHLQKAMDACKKHVRSMRLVGIYKKAEA